MKEYAAAGYVYICSYFLPVSSCKKRKETKVIQLWHSGGLLKKMGYDTKDDIPRDYKGDVTANYDLYYFPTISWSYRRNTWHHVHYPHKLISSRQWYVPSSTEMRYLLMNQVAVNATLDSLGYPTLEDKTYWSSTETGTRGAASVRMQNGQIVIGDSLKTLELYVRAIRTY